MEQLFALVAEGIAAATDVLLAGDRAVAVTVAEREEAVDTIYRSVEAMVDEQLALQAPVATELRFMLSALRVVPELARSHDLVQHITRRGAQGLGAGLTPRARGLIERMGRVGSDMWRSATDAWHDHDSSAAERMVERDEEMDDLQSSMMAELAAGQMSLPVVMEMVLVSRFYERLGDHAVNVTRRIAHLASGWVQSQGPSA